MAEENVEGGVELRGIDSSRCTFCNWYKLGGCCASVACSRSWRWLRAAAFVVCMLAPICPLLPVLCLAGRAFADTVSHEFEALDSPGSARLTEASCSVFASHCAAV